MTFRMRAAQQALLAQAHAAGTLATALAAKGFVARQGQTPGEVLVDDKRGKRSRILIDAHGRLSQIVSPLGRSHQLYYDDQHRITGLVEPNGLTTQLSYTPSGLLAALGRDEQRWGFAWDADANLIKATLPDGTPYTASHQGPKQLESTARGAESPIRIERSDGRLPSALVEATGARTTFEYGVWSQPDRTLRA
ncbi:MAG: RHS repeat domain-containing protein, partial [Polyangiaceae bacterium]